MGRHKQPHPLPGTAHLTRSSRSSSGRRRPGAGTVRCSSCSPAAPPCSAPLPPLLPPRPPPPPPLPRCPPPVTLVSCWSPSGGARDITSVPLAQPMPPRSAQPQHPAPGEQALPVSYLPIVDTRIHFSLDTSIICWIHPEQKLPAAGEGDGQRVEYLLGMDAGGKRLQSPTVLALSLVQSHLHRTLRGEGSPLPSSHW